MRETGRCVIGSADGRCVGFRSIASVTERGGEQHNDVEKRCAVEEDRGDEIRDRRAYEEVHECKKKRGRLRRYLN